MIDDGNVRMIDQDDCLKDPLKHFFLAKHGFDTLSVPFERFLTKWALFGDFISFEHFLEYQALQEQYNRTEQPAVGAQIPAKCVPISANARKFKKRTTGKFLCSVFLTVQNTFGCFVTFFWGNSR